MTYELGFQHEGEGEINENLWASITVLDAFHKANLKRDEGS